MYAAATNSAEAQPRQVRPTNGDRMSIELTRFSVFGLHAKFDVNIPIRDNKLVLIGVNGLGKTTVVNLIYFLLTSQWSRLLETDFTAIETEINGATIRLERQDVQYKLSITERQEKAFQRFANRSIFPARHVQRLLAHPLFEFAANTAGAARDKAVRELARDVELPASYVLRVLTELPRSMTEDLFQTRKETPAMAEFLSVMKQVKNHQVIYLPTYRRIEQDLKAIFPALDDDDLRKLTARQDVSLSPRVKGHIELVHFGMQDVERKIADELETIRERTRSQLTNLTASYLKDIIRNRADEVETDVFRGISDDTVTAVLDRVEENTLNQQDKQEVRSAIHRIRSQGAVTFARDKYLAYFFSRLLEIYVSLSGSERNIRRLIDTCNEYLENKRVVYDDASFSALIVDEDDSQLTWKMLSSGEKQVASLFTHLYLSRDIDQTVIIDEPELSLSVPWQKRLLTDIAESDKCNLLIAVTHSPFIYSNALDPYAIDLSKCIRPAVG